MNFLAHAYLSFNQHAILVGNMISDFVKGKKQFDYPSAIRQGIAIHRMIDTFTDEHPATKEAKKVFSAHYGLYSGPFTDIVYDHFLANDNSIFTESTLCRFAEDTYAILDKYVSVFPSSFGQVFPYMKKYNWLLNYRFYKGIENSFAGIAHRAKYMTESQTAFLLFKENYSELQQRYNEFFPALKEFCLESIQALPDK